MIKSIKDYFFFRVDGDNWWSDAMGFHKCGDISLMMVFHFAVYKRIGITHELLGINFETSDK